MKVDLFTAESDFIKRLEIPPASDTSIATVVFHNGSFYVLDEHTREKWNVDGGCHYIAASIYFDSIPLKLFPGLQTEPSSKSIPMLLWCPECKARHIDEGEFATKVHHTHACQTCGHVWRPAVVATTGVRFLPGYKTFEPEKK